MNTRDTDPVSVLKALADANRLMIVELLSCGELCACKILDKLNITQPTLSHHMRVLCDCGLVSGRREGKWMHYSLDRAAVCAFQEFLARVTSPSEDCLCR